MLYSTMLYSTMLYSTMLYSTMLYSTMLYSTTAQCVNCTPPGAASTESAASTPGHPGTGGASLTGDAPGSLGLQPLLRVRTDLWRVALQLLMVVMCLAAVAGNLLVVVIIAVTKQFHSVTSIFLVNLAVSDFLVGVGVMPFVAMSVVYDGWVLQQGLCLYVGYTCTLYCTASVLTLAAIALDRYRAIIDCFNYSSQANVRRTVGTVGWIWVQAALSSSPPALGWGRFAYSSWAFRCAVDSASSPGYTVFAAACSFALPACVMIFCYVRIVQVARDHARRIHDIETQLQRNGKKKSDECEKEEQTRRKRRTKHKHKKKKKVVVVQQEVQEEALRGSAQPIAGIPTTNSLPGEHFSGTAANLSVPSFSSTGYNSSSTTSSSSSSASSSFEHPAARVFAEPHSEETPSGSEPATRARSRRHDLFARYNAPGREHHGAFRLFLVIFAFFCCWLPYEVVSLALAVRPAAGVPYTVLTLASWLALLNSAVNPLLYALLSKRFRKALGSLRQRLAARLSLVVGADRVHSSPFALSNATNNHQQQQQQRELSQQQKQHHVHHQQTFQQLSLQHHHHHNNNHQLQQDEHHAFDLRDLHLNNHHNHDHLQQLQQQQQANKGCCRRQSGNGNGAGAVPMSVLSEAAGELRCDPHGRSYSLFSIASLADTGTATPGISPIFHQLDPPAHQLRFSGLQQEAQLLRASAVGPRGCEHSNEVLLNPLELETCLEEQQQQHHVTLEVPVLPFQPLTNAQQQLEHRTADEEATIATTPSSTSSSPCAGSTFTFGKITVEVDDCETRH
ncbi:uncharacterized protein LOC144933652 [Lampetra fluviatilis]